MIQITFILLICIALIHFYWAIGGDWGLDKAIPVDMNDNRLLTPLLLLTALIGIIMLGFAYIAYALWQHNSNPYIIYAGWSIGVVFLLRAFGDFKMVGIFKRLKGTEFSKYDTYFYIPLCLFIGVSFIVSLL
ncbi:MAG TPA: DUF3995 domain-containing protein [Epsilonproteobacteria bacterium]|nr:DUF3995 domain-containing protein [Campylobacterota bacterium]HHH53372.1 DUF3995 domain-containing protein [Bacteroidota bacterium]